MRPELLDKVKQVAKEEKWQGLGFFPDGYEQAMDTLIHAKSELDKGLTALQMIKDPKYADRVDVPKAYSNAETYVLKAAAHAIELAVELRNAKKEAGR